MSKVTISITTREGTIAYLGSRGDGSSNWRMLKKNGQGTLPMPKRFQKRRPKKTNV